MQADCPVECESCGKTMRVRIEGFSSTPPAPAPFDAARYIEELKAELADIRERCQFRETERDEARQELAALKAEPTGWPANIPGLPWEVWSNNGCIGIYSAAARHDVLHVTHEDGRAFHQSNGVNVYDPKEVAKFIVGAVSRIYTPTGEKAGSVDSRAAFNSTLEDCGSWDSETGNYVASPDHMWDFWQAALSHAAQKPAGVPSVDELIEIARKGGKWETPFHQLGGDVKQRWRAEIEAVRNAILSASPWIPVSQAPVGINLKDHEKEIVAHFESMTVEELQAKVGPDYEVQLREPKPTTCPTCQGSKVLVSEGHVACPDCSPKAHTCRLECQQKGEICNAPNEGKFCTRRKGHDGPHVACEDSDHDLAVWEDVVVKVVPETFEQALQKYDVLAAVYESFQRPEHKDALRNAWNFIQARKPAAK